LRLIGYADPDPQGLGILAVSGIKPGQAFADHQAMLRALRPDYVMIGSPNHLHLAHITAALQAGCHVFSENPVVITSEETWAAAELLRPRALSGRSGLTFVATVSQHRRGHCCRPPGPSDQHGSE